MTPAQFDLEAGAEVAVRTCMNVAATDRAVIITDENTLPIGQALARQAAATGAATLTLRLESFAGRPLTALPDDLREQIIDFQPTVSFFAAGSLPGEYPFRMTLSQLLRERFNTRHAHMPGITPLLMTQGMAVDYRQISALTHRVTELARGAQRIHVTNPAGTDLVAGFRDTLRWYPCHGLYHEPGDRGNLPEGETFTSPAWIEGVIVADVLGDYFSEKYSVLAQPVTFEIEDSRATEIRCADTALAAEISAYLDSDPQGRRVGEFAIGTNIALHEAVGNLLQDEKIPGIHIAFGSPLPTYTGADWICNLHVDVIPLRCTIDVDGHRLMTEGVFSPDILAGV